MNKNALLLVAALVLGGIAALITVMHVRDRITVAEQEAARSVQRFEEVEVVVSRRDLNVGDVLHESDMASRRVPVDFVPADSIRPGEHDPYVGRVVRGPVRQGVPLSANVLISTTEQFSRIIQPGRVGYTLSVNENNSISGMITPGDRVDILLTFDSDRTSSGNNNGQASDGGRVVALLENVLVLATGQKVDDVPGTERSDRGFSTVTLELDPDHAERLTVGQQVGSIRVILRNTDDQTPFGLEGVSERELLTSFGEQSGGNRLVEYIIGGR